MRAHLFERSDVSVVLGRIRCCKGTPAGVGPFSLKGLLVMKAAVFGAAGIGPCSSDIVAERLGVPG